MDIISPGIYSKSHMPGYAEPVIRAPSFLRPLKVVPRYGHTAMPSHVTRFFSFSAAPNAYFPFLSFISTAYAVFHSPGSIIPSILGAVLAFGIALNESSRDKSTE